MYLEKRFSFILSTIILLLVSYCVHVLQLESILDVPNLIVLTLATCVVVRFASPRFHTYVVLISGIMASYLLLGLVEGSQLIGLIIFYYSLAHMPLSQVFRIILMIAVGILLGFLHAGYLGTNLGIDNNIIAIASYVFIFRMIYYMYETKHDKSIKFSLHNFSYFFLFPNLFIPLFPIIDYRKFRSSFHKKLYSDKLLVSGVNLIVLAIIQLCIYRLLYLFFTPSVAEVNSFSSLSEFILMSYLHVCRLMGLLNLSVGILRVLGYDLPDIFNNMFLATSVLDYFRRINIYWKDFILRVFYYPIYKSFKGYSLTLKLMIAGVFVFILNWILHDYQWFWILGSYSIKYNNLIYWGVFGVLALTGMYLEIKNNRKKVTDNVILVSLKYSIKVFLTFVLMAFLWSLWISPSLEKWINLLKLGTQESGQLSVVMLVSFIGALFLFLIKYFENEVRCLSKVFNQEVLLVCYLIFLIAFSGYITYNKYCVEADSKYVLKFLNNIDSVDDEKERFVGYYDVLISNNIGSNMWVNRYEENQKIEINKKQYINLDDPRFSKFVPNSSFRNEHGSMVTINSLGLRDQEYDLGKSFDGVNIGIFGGSIEQGSVVYSDDVFESIIEEKYNEEVGPLRSFNFSMGHYTLPQYYYIIKHLDSQYDLDYALFFLHLNDDRNLVRSIERIIERKCEQPEIGNLVEYYKDNEGRMNRKKDKEFAEIITDWALLNIYELCIERNIKPVFVLCPKVNQLKRYKTEKFEDHKENFRKSFTPKLADIGYLSIDILDAFDGHTSKELRSSEKNYHPNAIGHSLLADSLYPHIKILLDNSNHD